VPCIASACHSWRRLCPRACAGLADARRAKVRQSLGPRISIELSGHGAMKLEAGSRVLVVGAGIAGSATALFLARAGVLVDVYDAREEGTVEGGGSAFLRPHSVITS
jgi:NADPH-dependent 2,4-dienoyl-CoA reductase/sulfur reductase-like enzyme